MKLSVNMVIQILGIIFQAINAMSDFFPDKALVASIAALIQAVIGVLSHFKNPDGTPATVAYVPKKSDAKYLGLLMLFVVLMVAPCMAQETNQGYENFAAMGASWNQYASPGIAGSLLYAKRLGDSDDTYSFSYVDLISKSQEQFSAATSITTGVAKKLLKFGKARVYGTTGVGLLAGGENIGYSWTAGGALAIPLGKGFQVLPNVRVIKSSLTDFHAIYGLMLGFGK